MMFEKNLAVSDIEAIYDRLADAVDAAGAQKAALFLTKLALLCANEMGDRRKFEAAIDVALRDLGED